MTLPYDSIDSNSFLIYHEKNFTQERETDKLIPREAFPNSPPSTQSLYYHGIEAESISDFHEETTKLPFNISNTISENVEEIEELERNIASLTNDYLSRDFYPTKQKNDTRFLIREEIKQLKQKIPSMIIKDVTQFNDIIKPGHYLKESKTFTKKFQLYFEFEGHVYILGNITQEHIEGVYRAIERDFPQLFYHYPPRLKVTNPSRLRIF